MKATAEIKKPVLELGMSRVWDYLMLFKPRVSVLVLVTTCLGFYLGSSGELDRQVLLHTLIGMGLVAASGCALNQLLERHTDAKMQRTANRPLPAGRLQPAEVQWLGLVLGAAGVLYLALSVSLQCSLFAAFTLASYVFVYTPMKHKTPLAVFIGAVPGALPPVIGWVAARGELDLGGWMLFGILFLWQLPHFYAIAWMYRRDYARARIPVLAVVDPDGRRTAISSILGCIALLLFSVLPTVQGFAGNFYLAGAIGLGAIYLASSVGLVFHRTDEQARWVFRVSLLYLPLLLGLLAYDRIPL